MSSRMVRLRTDMKLWSVNYLFCTVEPLGTKGSSNSEMYMKYYSDCLNTLIEHTLVTAIF